MKLTKTCDCSCVSLLHFYIILTDLHFYPVCHLAKRSYLLFRNLNISTPVSIPPKKCINQNISQDLVNSRAKIDWENIGYGVLDIG